MDGIAAGQDDQGPPPLPASRARNLTGVVIIAAVLVGEAAAFLMARARITKIFDDFGTTLPYATVLLLWLPGVLVGAVALAMAAGVIWKEFTRLSGFARWVVDRVVIAVMILFGGWTAFGLVMPLIRLIDSFK